MSDDVADEHGSSAPQTWRRLVPSATVVLASFAGGLVLLYQVLETGPGGSWRQVDLVCGALACLALVWRRRAPVVVALVLAAAASVVASAGVANMVALYFVARFRSLLVAVAVAVAEVASGWVFWLVYPGNKGLSLTLTVNIAIAAAVTAWGALLQAQSALLDAYRERAERAEREEALREDRIRATERTRIAREMHDVVAHRISLVALHAGGLEVAPDHLTDQVREAASLIRSSAVLALDELRAAIGVLREDEPRSLDRPGLDRLGDLVQEARAAGQEVELVVDLQPVPAADGNADPLAAPGVGRDVYRIVQEGLTNARKHAPGEPVRVAVTRADEDVEVVLVNSCVDRFLGVPGTGSGLIGLVERAALAGGELSHGVAPTGDFEVRARLPWR
ncbi:signal transduction histidine kinase [Marmoricola sp. URHA0025 HA25]